MLERLRHKDDDDPLAALTDQERKILEHIAEGMTNRQIGEAMFLAEKTVKNYVSNMFAKLGMSRRTEAAAVRRPVVGAPRPQRPSRPRLTRPARRSFLRQVEDEPGVDVAVLDVVHGLVDGLESSLFADHRRAAVGVQLERLRQVDPGADDASP